MRALKIVVASAAVLISSLTALAVPGHAETWRSRDARHDVNAVAYSLTPPPCGTLGITSVTDDERRDILSVRAVHDFSDVRLRLKVVRLTRRAGGYTFHLMTPTGRYLVEIGQVHRVTSVTVSRVRRVVDECGLVTQVITPIPCSADPKLDLRRDTAAVTVPRSCLKDPSWIRVGAFTNGPPTGSDDNSVIIKFDWWTPPGTQIVDTNFIAPLGPRIHRS